MSFVRHLVAGIVLTLSAACAPLAPESPSSVPESATGDEGLLLQPASFTEIPGWTGGRQAGVLGAFLRSCAKLDNRLGDNLFVKNDPRFGRYVDWRLICAEAARQPAAHDGLARAFLVRNFRPFQVVAEGGLKQEGLFTGYYEAEIRAARVSSARYWVPVLGKPRDLVTMNLGQFRENWKGRTLAGRVKGDRLIPHASRHEIARGALKDQHLAFLWADDPVDLFFLHVQGSGRALLPDGSVLRVGYAGTNGHPYKSIGKILIERGEVSREAMSMQAIRQWITNHPDQGLALLNENPSYVFLKAYKGDGPLGAQGVPLTPGRSLAVDSKFIPYGVPLWLDTTDPVDPEQPLRRMVVAQDTGGAIRGPLRGDLFWGHGQVAEHKAGLMKQTGGIWLLLPRPPGS
ncbi:GH102 : Membrane-bound lytic murein transglycosylase A [Magnetospira sp. QH-2]|nr:GH102 : Membrane-bound lytic murein transglycosylase A [Magnetospira sp. QH-2]